MIANIAETAEETPDLDRHVVDVCIELGTLSDGTIVSESALARMFGKHPVSIKRAVDRGELPPPTKLMGKPVWTAGSIRRHIEERLALEARCRREMEERMRQTLS